MTTRKKKKKREKRSEKNLWKRGHCDKKEISGGKTERKMDRSQNKGFHLHKNSWGLKPSRSESGEGGKNTGKEEIFLTTPG